MFFYELRSDCWSGSRTLMVRSVVAFNQQQLDEIFKKAMLDVARESNDDFTLGDVFFTLTTRRDILQKYALHILEPMVTSSVNGDAQTGPRSCPVHDDLTKDIIASLMADGIRVDIDKDVDTY